MILVGETMKDRFVLEQNIMNCWEIIDDLQLLSENIIDSDRYNLSTEEEERLTRKLDGIKELYEMRFDRMWDTFEEMIKHGQL